MVTNYYQGNGNPLQATTVSPRVFKFLKRHSDNLMAHERLVVLSFNEFAFKDYVPMTQEGYNGGEKLPSHLIVPSIRFVVSKRFHFLGSLFFHSDYLTKKPDKFGKDISECIKLYILALENINLKVIATVCPLSAAFHHAIEILTQVTYMEEFDGPLVYSVGRNKEIIHIHDPKYVRDSFIRWFMLFDLKFSLNGKQFEASREDILDVLEINNRPPLLQKAPNNSVYYNQVSYYYFNEQVSLSIRRLIKQGFLSSHAIGTSIFINMFRQLFHRIYGLNEEECEMFDFDRMNEYIEFIKSIHPVPQYLNEDDQQELASSLPNTTTLQKKKPNRELNALEKFVKETPSSYSELYNQSERSLDVLKQEDMYEPIMISTASGKNFNSSSQSPVPKKTKSKNKKKNKKDRKKQKHSELLSYTEDFDNLGPLPADPKDDLLLFYRNSPKDPPDNGEFLLCTPKKYEEMNSSFSNSYQLAADAYRKENLLSIDTTKYYQESTHRKEQKHQSHIACDKERKVLSPVQNRNDIYAIDSLPEITKIHKNSEQITHSNLNENIRKYKNVNKNNLGAVRKITLEDESNKENMTDKFIPNISMPENVVSTTTEQVQDLNLDDEIKEISYSISDPEDSTEYQFEQSFATTNHTGIDSDNISKLVTNQSQFSYGEYDKTVNKETMGMLVQNYLSQEQIKNLMQGNETVDNSLKFDSFINYLKDRSAQYTAILNHSKNMTENKTGEFVKISRKDNDRVDIERVTSNNVPHPPSDLFEINCYNNIETTCNEVLLNETKKSNEMQINLKCSVNREVTDELGNPINIVETETHPNVPKHKTYSSDGSSKGSVKITSKSIEKIKTDILNYDPLNINANSYCTNNSTDASTGKNELPNYLKCHQSISNIQQMKPNFPKDTDLDSGKPNIDNTVVSGISSCSGNFMIRKTDSVTLCSKTITENNSVDSSSFFHTKLNNECSGVSNAPLLPIPRIYNPTENRVVETGGCVTLQSDFSSGSDEEFHSDKLNVENNIEVELSEEQTEKGISSDFNSEYDDFDETLINKHVRMIINKLEEKDEEIARVMNQLDVIEKKTQSVNKEHVKRGYIKKEIYPKGESSKTGTAKRTIFHREKTEESNIAPINVIKNSENSCDKSRIASTKANYNETLGVKSKKQLAKIKDEQYKKVASTISHTIKRFSNIFNLPDSDEEKSLRISRASLDFVYDLKRVNDVTDVKAKQKILDDAYDKLCLSILGSNSSNPSAQDKMKELMSILQEIASPRHASSDLAADTMLSQHVNETLSAPSIPDNRNSQPVNTKYVREDVQNLWINNVRSIERLFKCLGSEKIYFELTPELFRTDHVELIMQHIQGSGPRVETFPVDERCLPLDLIECFDTLKPYGSVLLLDD